MELCQAIESFLLYHTDFFHLQEKEASEQAERNGRGGGSPPAHLNNAASLLYMHKARIMRSSMGILEYKYISI